MSRDCFPVWYLRVCMIISFISGLTIGYLLPKIIGGI